MIQGPPKLPGIKLPPSLLDPLRDIIRGGRERVEKAGSDIRSLADELHNGIPGMTTTIQGGGKTSGIEPQVFTTRPGAAVSKLTSDETLAYQKKEIAKELWQLEKHLAQGCRIPDNSGKRIPCDCCEKGTFIAGLAYESIPIAERAGQTSDVFDKIAHWSEDLAPMVTITAVESGKHDYKKLSGEASALRKELMGTLALSAMAGEVTLDEAKKLAAEEAAKEIERKWHSQEKK
jgi:hypothetical protein